MKNYIFLLGGMIARNQSKGRILRTNHHP